MDPSLRLGGQLIAMAERVIQAVEQRNGFYLERAHAGEFAADLMRIAHNVIAAGSAPVFIGVDAGRRAPTMVPIRPAAPDNIVDFCLRRQRRAPHADAGGGDCA